MLRMGTSCRMNSAILAGIGGETEWRCARKFVFGLDESRSSRSSSGLTIKYNRRATNASRKIPLAAVRGPKVRIANLSLAHPVDAVVLIAAYSMAKAG